MTNFGDKATRTDATAAGQATPPLVVVDHEIMGGLPCFAGTRVPGEVVVASVDKGISWADLVAAYPFLTEAHVAAARAFLASPEGERRRSTSFPSAFLGKVIERRVVKPARREPNAGPGAA